MRSSWPSCFSVPRIVFEIVEVISLCPSHVSFFFLHATDHGGKYGGDRKCFPMPQIIGNCGSYAAHFTGVRSESCARSEFQEVLVERNPILRISQDLQVRRQCFIVKFLELSVQIHASSRFHCKHYTSKYRKMAYGNSYMKTNGYGKEL